MEPEKKSYTGFRLLMLGVIAMICFGTYFSYDEISPFESLWTTNVTANGTANPDVNDKYYDIY